MAGKFAQADLELKETYLNKEGLKVNIFEVRGRDTFEFSKNKKGYIVEVDGEKVGYTGDEDISRHYNIGNKIARSESLGAAREWAKSQYGDEGVLMDSDEYKTFKKDEEAKAEAKDLKSEYRKQTQSVRQQAEDATQAQKKIAEMQTGKITSRNIAAIEKALLSQGDATPEEIQTVTARGMAEAGRIAIEQGARADATLSNTLLQLANQDVQAIKDASSLEMALQGLNQDLLKHDMTLANALDVSKIQAQATTDAARTGAWGDTAEEAAKVAAAIIAASDYHLKENIKLVNVSDSGVNVYEFEYKDKTYGDGRYRGVIAQEVPWASHNDSNGYLLVDYSKIDVNFERVA